MSLQERGTSYSSTRFAPTSTRGLPQPQLTLHHRAPCCCSPVHPALTDVSPSLIAAQPCAVQLHPAFVVVRCVHPCSWAPCPQICPPHALPCPALYPNLHHTLPHQVFGLNLTTAEETRTFAKTLQIGEGDPKNAEEYCLQRCGKVCRQPGGAWLWARCSFDSNSCGCPGHERECMSATWCGLGFCKQFRHPVNFQSRTSPYRASPNSRHQLELSNSRRQH